MVVLEELVEAVTPRIRTSDSIHIQYGDQEWVKHAEGTTVFDELDVLLHYSELQFAEGTGRHRVQMQYVEAFEKTVAQNFIQARGRAGKVLVMNQDFVLLLTNLAIGNRTRLRFQEVIKELQNRGFCFDKHSQQTLINFFERIGLLSHQNLFRPLDRDRTSCVTVPRLFSSVVTCI